MPDRSIIPTKFGFHIETFATSMVDVALNGSRLVVMYGAGLFPEHTRRIEPAADAWRRFLEAMDRCRIWSWEPDYYLPAVDGTGWRVHLEVAGKRVESAGRNAYPGVNGPEEEPTPEPEVFWRRRGRSWAFLTRSFAVFITKCGVTRDESSKSNN